LFVQGSVVADAAASGRSTKILGQQGSQTRIGSTDIQGALLVVFFFLSLSTMEGKKKKKLAHTASGSTVSK